MSDKITIYLPVYNGANFIECAIKSVLQQTHKDLLLLISDNASTDETVSVVNKYIKDDRITLIQQPYNFGMINQGNFLLSQITTKYCMGICHDDFFYDESALQEALEIVENNENIAAVYCNMFFVDEQGNPILENKYYFKGLTSGDVVAKKSIIKCRNLYSIPLLIRTNAIKGFRYTDDFYHTSDVDFSISISKGNQIYYIPKPLVALRFHKSNNTARDYSKFIEEFKELAMKYDIKLSKSEKIQMEINHRITVLKKHLFYFYLDNIRR